MAIKFLSGQTISGTLTVSGNVQGATFNGLAINTTGTNNVANQIVRTQANGYVNFGWINSISGNHTGSITRITASNDAYLRYVTPAQFRTGVTDGFYAPSSTVSGVTSVATGNGLTGGTITSTGTLTMSGSYTGAFSVTGFTSSTTGFGINYVPGATVPMVILANATTYGIFYREASPDHIEFKHNNAVMQSFDGSGNVTMAGDLTVSGGDITLGGTGRIQGVDTVSASTDAANKAYVDAHPGSGGTVTSVATGNGLTGGTITSTGTLSMSGTYSGTFQESGAHGSSQIGCQLPAANNGANTGVVNLRMWCSEPGVTWDWAGFGYNVTNNNGSPGGFGRLNTAFGQAYQRYGTTGNMYFYNTNTSGTRVTTLTLNNNGQATFGYTVTAPTITATGVVYANGGNSNTWNSHTSNTGTVTSVATGSGLTGGTITTTGTLSLDRPNSQLGAVLATYGTTAGASGRVRCTAPFNTNTGKMFSIEITLYTSYTQHNYVVSAYMYSTTNQWYSPKAIYTTTGTASPDIYVGRDGNGKAYISIANGSYTGVLVHNMTRGYQTSLADTYDPWTITINSGNENSTSVAVSTVYTSANLPAYPSVGNGQIDGRTSGLGISGSMDATANQTGNTTFTVTSNAVEAATASTLVYRNSSADINVRLLRANYQDQGTISGAIAYRVNNSSDNYTRYCSSSSAIRTFLGVPASGDLGNYLPLAGGTMTGILTANAQITANSTLYLKDRITLPASGLSSVSGRPGYAIYQEGGSWSSPFPDLCIAMHTGIKFGANASYNGMRFYDDYTMATQVMSVNNVSDALGAGNVYVNNSLQAGSSLRAPIFYDSNNTTYYGDFAATSNMFQGYYKGKTDGWSLQLGDANITRVYDDDARASLVINAAYYPHLYINANTSNSNLNHGPVFSMTGNISGGGFRRWSMGISNTNPNMLTIGTYDNNTNPHYGCGGDVLGEATWGSKFWLDSSSNLQTSGSMRSPIFYDSNNTGYYMDPASTSNLNAATFAGDITVNGNQVFTLGGNADVKFAVWDSTTYGIGMTSGVTLGNLNDYAMTFCMNNDDDRGFWWGYNGQSKGAGAMSLTTNGRLYVTTHVIAPIYYDTNTVYYGDFAGTSNFNTLTLAGSLTVQSGSGTINGKATQLFEHGYGSDSGTFYQTSGSFAGYSGWANYWIGNHGNGATYYNTVDIRPFWGPPKYSRLEGGTFRGPYNYVTNETDQTIGVYLQSTTSLRAPIFYDYNNTAFYLDPSTTGTSVNVAGDVVAYASSDIRFKNNITPITNALDKLSKIGGYTFEWNEISHKETGKKDIGVVAQEVEEILPEIVQTRSNGYKAVDYQKLTALLIESVKEQQVIINDLKTRIETLENN